LLSSKIRDTEKFIVKFQVETCSVPPPRR